MLNVSSRVTRQNSALVTSAIDVIGVIDFLAAAKPQYPTLSNSS